MKKCICLLLVLVMSTAAFGCTPTPSDGDITIVEGGKETDEKGAILETAPPAPAEFAATESDMFTDRDGRASYDQNKSINIKLSGSTAEASAASVKIEGGKITLTEDATYIVSGTLDDGQIIVNAPETAKMQIVLQSASITSSRSAALYIVEADKVFLTLVGDSYIANGGTFDESEGNIDGALFSKQDLTVNGEGSLTVTSPAGHGIVCKDDLVLYGGALNITAASHAIDANDSVRVKHASLALTAGKDGIHAENSEDSTRGFVYISSGKLDITSEGDGIDAGAYLQIEGGEINVLAGGGYENGDKQSSSGWGGFPGGGGFPSGGYPSGEFPSGEFPSGEFPSGGDFGGGKPDRGERPEGAPTLTFSASAETESAATSMKGLKAETGLLVSLGNITVNSADDAIHSNMSLTINGGTLSLSTGDDGLHAEESLTVTAGSIKISESYEGLEALHIYIEGGNIQLSATDDGLNAAGGADGSGGGGRDGMFGGFGGGGFGGFGGNSDGSITISGGAVAITASGDGIDANGTLEISGGSVSVTGPTSGDTSILDYDKTGKISGGSFIGSGARGMSQTLSSVSQGVLTISASGSADVQITVTDSDGKTVLTYTPSLSFQMLVISAPEIRSGETYTVKIGADGKNYTAK